MFSQRFSRSTAIRRNSFGYRPFRLFATCSFLPLQSVPYPTVSSEGFSPNSHRDRPCVEMERVLPSKVAAISPFVDKLMLLIKKCRCAPVNETDIEIALREALENAVIHGNHEAPGKHVYVSCRCEAEEGVSITVTDEGQGFDSNALPDPTAPGAIESSHGRGI